MYWSERLASKTGLWAVVLTVSPGAGAHTTTEVMTARKAMIERRMVVNDDEGMREV